jgi:Tfp pilus assembly protein PilX
MAAFRDRDPRTGRSGERGVALFIVVMVVTLLGAVGVFAARTASMVDMASGYSREASQTVYLAGYASRFAAVELGQGRAAWYIDRMREGTEQCPSNQNATAADGFTLPCYKLDNTDVTARVQEQLAQAALVDQDADEPGSLGPPLGIDSSSGGMQAAFMVELLDAFQTQGMPGMNRGGGSNPFINVQLTVTGWAQVRPRYGPAGTDNPWCDAAASSDAPWGAASVQAVRVLITVPNQASL